MCQVGNPFIILSPTVTLTCIDSIFEGGAAKVLENSEGARTTPSVVAFGKGRFLSWE